MGIAMVKALIKMSDDVQEWKPMLALVQGINTENEKQIVSEICSENFIDFVLSKINQIMSDPNPEFIIILENIFNFLVSITDKSSLFCHEVTKDDNMIKIIKLIIGNENEWKNFHEYAILLINNIGFQLESSYFADEDVRKFLLQNIESQQKTMCVLCLMRFSSAEQIISLEEDICSIIPEVVSDFVDFFNKNKTNQRFNIGLVEILKNIKILYRNDRARINLIGNNDFNTTVNRMVNDSNFIAYKDLIEEISNLLRGLNTRFCQNLE